MLTKEEIKSKLQEDPSWTLPDEATDADWDLYLQVKNEKTKSTFDNPVDDDLKEFSDDEPDELDTDDL